MQKTLRKALACPAFTGVLELCLLTFGLLVFILTLATRIKKKRFRKSDLVALIVSGVTATVMFIMLTL